MFEANLGARRVAMQSLELSFNDRTRASDSGVPIDGRPSVIVSFLGSFEGLENMRIALDTGSADGWADWHILRAASHHRKTLRQLLYQQQSGGHDLKELQLHEYIEEETA